MEFDMPKENGSIIKVLGVGGGGSNAVNHMYREGIKGVDFIVVNTDQQALDISPVPTKVQIGANLTEGMGAGSIPEVGKNAAMDDLESVREHLKGNTKMAFVTAGMGGGTGTGAGPVIASAAREMGVLTVGIVTLPFDFEGKKRHEQAEEGIQEMRDSVDTLLIIRNERLREMYGNLTSSNAFSQADDVLATAAKGIAEVITVPGWINVDFKDVNTVMKDSGVAILGSSKAQGEKRAAQAVEDALSSPLLNDNDISGAQYVLLNITYGDEEVLMDEMSEITDHIQEEAGSGADVIWGQAHDPSLGEHLSVTIIATGFKSSPDTGSDLDQREAEKEKRYIHLDKDEPEPSDSSKEEGTDPRGDRNSERSEKNEGEEAPFLKGSDASGADRESSREEEVRRYHLDDPTGEREKEADDGGRSSEEKSEKGNERKGEGYPVEKRAAERMGRIREMTMKLRSHSGISDLEKEPAYRRKNIELEDPPASDRSEVSRYTLSKERDDEESAGIQKNNPYLHDKPD